MYLLTISQTLEISGGIPSQYHTHSVSMIDVMENECYVSNILGVKLCFSGIYDLDGNLIHKAQPATYDINGFSVEAKPYSYYKYQFSVTPNIFETI